MEENGSHREKGYVAGPRQMPNASTPASQLTPTTETVHRSDKVTPTVLGKKMKRQSWPNGMKRSPYCTAQN